MEAACPAQTRNELMAPRFKFTELLSGLLLLPRETLPNKTFTPETTSNDGAATKQ